MIRPPTRSLAALLLTGLWFVSPGARGQAADLPSDLDQVPRDAAAFFHLRTANVWDTDWMSDVRLFADKAGPEAIKTFRQKFAPDPATIDRVTLVMPTPKTFNNPFPRVTPESVSALLIIHTRQPYDRLRVMQSLGLREKLYQRHLYYFDEELWSGLALIDNQTFVIGSEDALVKFFDQSRGGKKDGPLQAALQTAAGKHQLTVGLNPQLFGKEEMTKILPASMQKLLEARCGTLTLDLDKDIHASLRLDYDKEDDAQAGAKGLRDTLDLARQQLARTIDEGDKVLQKKVEKGPAAELAQNFGMLLALGFLRELDNLLKQAPIETKGATVSLVLEYKGLRSTELPAVGMFAMVGFGMARSYPFQSVASRIDGPGKDPHEEHLHNLATALDKYHEAKGSYPPPAILDKDGRPILSWRVALLPYLGNEGQALYKEFRLDEPWDSLHNKTLLKRMPQAYRSPDHGSEFKTSTQIFAGAESVFGPKGVVKKDLGPGAALLAEGPSDLAVYWSKPADFRVVEGKPLPELFGKYGYETLYVYFADGSYRAWSKDRVDEKTLRALATKAGAKFEKPKEKE